MIKHTWDYKSNPILLLDKVHNISNKVHEITHMGGITQVEMNFNTFERLDMKYLKDLNRRYRIVIYKYIPNNELLLTYADIIEGKITIKN